MKLALGSEGEQVADLQLRLSRLGYRITDPNAIFSDATQVAVSLFQSSRGLPTTGECDRTTWRSIVEAGYHFGDRVLYLHNPLMRGDDVGELQVRLGSLGFDPGRVDGYFGESTRTALMEFQANLALPTDGICGPSTIDELKRLFGRSKEHIHGVREREYLRNRTRSSKELSVVICAVGELASTADLFSLRLRQNGVTSSAVHDTDQSALAQIANSLQGDITIHLDFSTSGAQLAYYSGFSYSSPGGEQLAKFLARNYAQLLPTALTLKGMTLPILRETKMLTVAVQLSPASIWVNSAPQLAEATVHAILEFTNNPEL